MKAKDNLIVHVQNLPLYLNYCIKIKLHLPDSMNSGDNMETNREIFIKNGVGISA